MVGDPVAVVVAIDRYVAEDGADAVEVTYDPLPPVTCVEAVSAAADTPLPRHRAIGAGAVFGAGAATPG